jgi:hypothetical protein
MPVELMTLTDRQIAKQNLRDAMSVVWNLDRLGDIGGHSTTKLGQPVLAETPFGRGIIFNGIEDGLIVRSNPLDSAAAFTIEIIFWPDFSEPMNVEQRFLHIQNPDNENRRVLIELRHAANNEWFLDTFIKSEESSCTLYADAFRHRAGNWYHAALVYENGTMKHYVDGREELSGRVKYVPIESGHTAIGVRMNRRFWYKGAIRTIKVTRCALPPGEFLLRPSDTDTAA